MNFAYTHWIELPLSTRHKIAELFDIKRQRSIHVSNNEVIDDGYSIKHIDAALTLENIQKLLGTTQSDPATLWQMLIDKAEGREPVVIEPVVVPESKPVKVTKPKKIKKNAKKTGKQN